MSDPAKEENPEKSGSKGPDSEMFSVPRPRKAIPQLKDVPLTKEEIRRRKTVRTAILTGLVVAVLTALYLMVRANHRREIEAANHEAERTGRVAAIEAAIEALDGETGPGDVALAARLHAMAELAGVGGHRAPAVALLAQHEPSSEGASDHRIAETYLALAAGDVEEATRTASLLVPGRGPRPAEAGHAVARALLASGRVTDARAAADAALAAMPDSPRHLALLVEVAARGGGAPPESAGDATPLRLARARAVLESSGPSSAIRTDATAVHDAPDATPAERGWAELALGIAAAIDGDTLGAAEHVHAAVEHAPPGDELFTIEVAETLLDVGRRLEAASTAEVLTSPVSTDASRRALLTARQAVLHGDLEAAARAADAASTGPRRTLVLADIAGGRGETASARTQLESLRENAAFSSYAYFQLVQLLLAAGDRAGALTAIESAVAADPTHPRLAAAAAYALSGNERSADAFTALGRAEDAHPGEPLVLVARARVHARAAEWQQAYDALAAVASATEDDPQIDTERGQAARMLGRLDEARAAYSAALAIDPHQATALVALLAVQTDTHDLDGAMASLEQIDAAHLADPLIDHLRASVLVERAAGESGVPRLVEAVGRSPDDGELRLALASLYMQAERWSDAADAYYAALSRTADRRLALGMRALALARGRRAPTVEAMLDQLRATVSSSSPLRPADLARIADASAWVEWDGGAYGRVSIFARQALDAVPEDVEATLLLAYVEDNAHRDPSERLRTIADRSIEARGWLAALATTPLDPAHCTDARAYLLAAPAGRFAEELGRRVGDCPP